MAGEAVGSRDPVELGDEPRLADARIAAHVDDGAAAAGAGAKQRGELRELRRAPDERRGSGVAASGRARRVAMR